METDLEYLITELNELHFDLNEPYSDYIEKCDILEDIVDDISLMDDDIKYDVLRNLICSYDDHSAPTNIVIESSLYGTERGIDFLQEILDNYKPGYQFETVIVGNTELNTPGQYMTNFIYELIEDYVSDENSMNENEDSSYDEGSIVYDSDVLDTVASKLVEDIFSGNTESASKRLSEILSKEDIIKNDYKGNSEATDKVCDAKIALYDVLPENVMQNLDNEEYLNSLYASASIDYLFYDGFEEMSDDVRTRNFKILRFGVIEEKEFFHEVFTNVALEMGINQDSTEFAQTYGNLLSDVLFYDSSKK